MLFFIISIWLIITKAKSHNFVIDDIYLSSLMIWEVLITYATMVKIHGSCFFESYYDFYKANGWF